MIDSMLQTLIFFEIHTTRRYNHFTKLGTMDPWAGGHAHGLWSTRLLGYPLATGHGPEVVAKGKPHDKEPLSKALSAQPHGLKPCEELVSPGRRNTKHVNFSTLSQC